MHEIILQAMFKLQEVRREEGIDEQDIVSLREAASLINEVILSQGETLDDVQDATVAVTSNGDISVSENVMQALARNREVGIRAKIYEDELRDDLLTSMQKHDIKKFENDVFTATQVFPSTSNRFGTAKFKKDHPELYDAYVTQSERKGYVKLSYKD